MEIWDAYNADGTLAGIDLVRGRPVPKGLYYMVCEILVRHEDGDYLLMQRAWTKPSFAGRMEATAGGAAQKGETAIMCAKRELYEETGITAEKIDKIGSMIFRNMIVHQFLCITDCPKDSVTLQEGETIAYKWVSEGEFIEFIDSGQMIETQRERMDEYFREIGYIK